MKKHYLILCLLFLYFCTEKGNINDSKHRNSNYVFYKENGKEGFDKFVVEQKKDFILFKLELLLEDAQGDPVKKAARGPL